MGNLLNGKGLDTYYTKLSSIASANCAQTYSFTWNGRSFPEETEFSQIMATNAPYLREKFGRQKRATLTNAFNDDLTDCVEVYTPASYLNHFGNGMGLFRSAKMLRPYLEGHRNLNPDVVQAVLQGLEEFQEKIASDCELECDNGLRCNQTECLTSQRTKFDRNNEFELFVQKAMDKISDSELNGLNLQPSF